MNTDKLYIYKDLCRLQVDLAPVITRMPQWHQINYGRLVVSTCVDMMNDIQKANDIRLSPDQKLDALADFCNHSIMLKSLWRMLCEMKAMSLNDQARISEEILNIDNQCELWMRTIKNRQKEAANKTEDVPAEGASSRICSATGCPESDAFMM